ncbi:hypothetical protein QAD02_024111 [Eretmocerus hayati]|uniref:Uncharacterized protein n=1 Tax=Eretmocerus hayati TaxID=131215 RepID=A0ACC2PZZ8_9HYME|nr:hypothetical protein QAD02_024111 [Eretmocerus hayati]
MSSTTGQNAQQSQAKGKKAGYWQARKSQAKTQSGSATTSAPEPAQSQSQDVAPDSTNQKYGEDDFTGLTPYRGRDTFAVTFEGYIPLAERAWSVLSTSDKQFGKNVSQSMFVWYATQLLYARVLAIQESRGELTANERNFINEMKGLVYMLPQPLVTYLKSIGDVVDAEGGKFYIEFPCHIGANGSFGRVDAANHWMYEACPAPLVVSMRIREDLAFTTEANRNRDWDLPAALRPAGQGAGTPTKNMLRWGRSVALSTEQRQMVENAGITPDDFAADRARYQSNRKLLNLIADNVKNAERRMKMETALPVSTLDTFGVLAYIEKDTHSTEPFSRTLSYCDTGNIQVVSPAQIDKRFVQGASLISLRVNKQLINNRAQYSCYDFGDYANVPADWQASANTIYVFGSQATWNRKRFTSAYGSRDAVRTHWIQKALVSGKG